MNVHNLKSNWAIRKQNYENAKWGIAPKKLRYKSQKKKETLTDNQKQYLKKLEQRGIL